MTFRYSQDRVANMFGSLAVVDFPYSVTEVSITKVPAI